MSDSGYNGLKAFGFTVGVTVLIFTTLYITKRYHPNLFGQETFSRHYSWYFSGPNVPLVTRPDRRGRPLGEKPGMWDVWIASWYPPCSQSESRLGGLGEGEGGEREASCTANGQKGPGWGGFLDIQPLSADKVSDAPITVSSLQAKGGCPVQPTPSIHQIQISTIILMPAPPRPTSPPSTSSPNPVSEDNYGPPREYALGTSCIPYTPDD